MYYCTSSGAVTFAGVSIINATSLQSCMCGTTQSLRKSDLYILLAYNQKTSAIVTTHRLRTVWAKRLLLMYTPVYSKDVATRQRYYLVQQATAISSKARIMIHSISSYPQDLLVMMTEADASPYRIGCRLRVFS